MITEYITPWLGCHYDYHRYTQHTLGGDTWPKNGHMCSSVILCQNGKWTGRVDRYLECQGHNHGDEDSSQNTKPRGEQHMRGHACQPIAVPTKHVSSSGKVASTPSRLFFDLFSECWFGFMVEFKDALLNRNSTTMAFLRN